MGRSYHKQMPMIRNNKPDGSLLVSDTLLQHGIYVSINGRFQALQLELIIFLIAALNF